jgi:HK97 family phage major capsid protein
VVPEGTLKPEATLTFTPHNAALDTIAHWKAITRQALEDKARIQSIVEGALRRGLLQKIEKDLAAAIGTGVTATADGAGNFLNGIRNGIAVVEGKGYSPSVVLLNPSDYAALDIATISALGGAGERRGGFWGLRAIPVASLTAGTAIVGDPQAVTLFQRGTAQVLVADQHADLFLRNALVVLAETRVKSAVTEPAGLVKVTEGTAP